MAENYPENESTVITTEELQGIDINQVDSMQLKDGTVVLVKEGEEMDEQEYDNQFMEEDQEQMYEECEGNFEDAQSNQLRARPMMGRMAYPMGTRPPVMPVAPMRPAVMKPMVVSRGPVRPAMPMGRVIFRGRPGTKNAGGFQQGGFGQEGGFGQPGFGGMGKQQGGFGQPGFGGMGKQQGGYGQPGYGGMGKQQGGYGQPGFGGMGKQQGGYGQPGYGRMGKQQGGFGPQQGGNNYKPQGNQIPTQGQRQTTLPLSQQIQYPGYNPNQQQGGNFRARPNIEEEQETNFQEEDFGGEEEYYENNEQYQEDTENQLRARPLIVPGGRVVLAPGYAPGPKKVVPVMPGMGVRRWPGPKVVMGGFNSYQPRYRARPGRVMVSTPRLTPFNATFQPNIVGRYGYGGVRPTAFKQGMRGFVPPPPIFRARPRSNSYDERDYDEQIYEEEYQCNTSYV